MKKIFITGCCGYIGSHTCVELLNNDYEIVGLDNFCNSNPQVLESIKKITGKSIKFYEGSLLDINLLDKIFQDNDIFAVIDFVAHKSASESIKNPLKYYINNVSSILVLLHIMEKHAIKNIIFSSSAAVYGNTTIMPATENCNIDSIISPYGTSKYFAERILQDLYNSDNKWSIIIFRYFNCVGTHKSGLLLNSNDNSENIMNVLSKVARKELKYLMVYGNDYPTKDGTGIRDYIHVVDLAKAHINGLEKINKKAYGINIYNIGTGKGYSVLEIIKTFEKVNNLKINYKIVARRAGDTAKSYADTSLINRELNWHAELGVEEMCKDVFNSTK